MGGGVRFSLVICILALIDVLAKYIKYYPYTLVALHFAWPAPVVAFCGPQDGPHHPVKASGSTL